MIRTVVNLRRKSMRTILVLFAVLTFIVPAQAVVITCVSESGGAVRIDYDASDETVLPIAFALDVSVDGGAVITRVYDYKVGDSNAASPGFGIFPWSMQLDGTGKIINWGTPDVNSAGAGTQPGLGTSGVTLEMASRYKSAADAPHVKGTLCRILVDTRGASTVNVKVAPNINGGGVVLENAADAKFSSVGCILGSSAPPSQLPAPASISYPADSNTGRYTVSWLSVNGATSYQLERSANNGSTWTQIYSGAALSYSETVTNGSYSYHVRATNAAGSSSWTTGTGSCVVSIPAPPAVPAPPLSISYPNSNNTGQYTINWSSSNGATSYQLERSADNGGTWTQVYSGVALSFSETVANGNYRYHVRATNTAGSSSWTTGSWNCVVSISAPPAAPAAPASISYPADSNTGRYTVSWPSSSGATSYQLERSANEGRQGRQGRKGREGRESRAAWIRIYSGKALSWSENVTDGRYSYRVRAINSAGSSSWRTGRDYCEVHIENRHENNENDEND